MIIDWASGANAQLVAYQWPVFNWITGESGAAPEPEVEAETPSGGWRRKAWNPGETETDRDVRIKADRIRMGILPPDPSETDASGITGDTTDHIANAGNMVGPSLGAYLLPEDLAGLEALAARAAELTIDAEIAMWMRLAEQRRLHAEWLRDEDDAAVLLLAIATIH
jgi:hypothetical protein